MPSARTAGNRKLNLIVALSYGGRAEIVEAARRIAEEVRAGRIDPAAVDEDLFARYPLYRRHSRSRSPDPHQRREAHQQFPALAMRLCRAGLPRPALARLHPGRSGDAPSASIMAAIAGMAPRAERLAGALRKRLLSAAVLLPLALAAVWLGPPYWDIAGRRDRRRDGLGMGRDVRLRPAAERAARSSASRRRARCRCWPWPWPGAAACQAYRLSLLLLVLGAALSSLLGMRRPGGRGAWQGFGTVYVGLPCIAIIWLRAQAPGGLATMVWVLALAIAVDTGAYAAGRLDRRARSWRRASARTRPGPGSCGGIAAAHGRGRGRGALAGLPPRSGRWCWRARCSASSSRRAIWWNRPSSAVSASRTAAISFPGHGGVLDRVDGLAGRSLLAVGIGSISWGRNAGMDAVKADLRQLAGARAGSRSWARPARSAATPSI